MTFEEEERGGGMQERGPISIRVGWGSRAEVLEVRDREGPSTGP